MKNITLKALIVSLIACSAGFVSCSDDDAESSTSSEIKRVTLSRKTDYGNDWIYFSLSKCAELDIDEESHYDDLTWDLAFNRYNVRTNSGASGAGQGGALDTEYTDLSAVTTVPSGEFAVDVEGEITESFTGSGVTYTSSTLSDVLASAIAFAGPPPTYTPNYHVFIIRTADGKYAKLQVEGFYDDEGNSGYMTFSYFYQPDGSTDLAAN